jgi:polysaccharide export outer membrane protein
LATTSWLKLSGRLGAILLCLAVAACAGTGAAPAPAAMPAAQANLPIGITPAVAEYRIAPLDKIDITVFQVKDLTVEDIQVDSSGRILLPLIGTVMASGRTATELADDVANLLRGRFLQSPQVSVRVREAANQRVTVDGAVVQPGVYQITTSTTLLQAVAMARGPDKDYANLKRVLVFRNIDGTRQVAVFNLQDIRSGKAADPAILANDVIVVDGSNVKGAWREVLRSLPGLAFFRPF